MEEAVPDYALFMLDPDGRITNWNVGAERITGYRAGEIIGQHISCLYLPDQQHGTPEHHLHQAAGTGCVEAEGWRVRRNGSRLWANVVLIAVRDDDGQLIGFWVVVHDLTARRQIQQAWEQRISECERDLERWRQAITGLRDILAIVNFNRPLNEVLGYLIAQLSRLLGADAGAIYRLDKAAGRLDIQVATGLDIEAMVGVPIGWGPISRAVLQRQPTAADLKITAVPDAHIPGVGPEHTAGWAQLAQQYAAVLAVPLIMKDEVYGALVLFQHAARTFCDEEIQVAVTFGDHAALAIENARLFAIAQEKATLEERQRLARELHDSVTQALYAMKLFAQAAVRRVAAGDTATVIDYLHELRAMAQDALQEMRLLIFELRPPILEQEGLVLAIQARLEAVEGRSGLQTEFTVDGKHRPAAEIEQALYRVAQEALNNALKHAQARRIVVVLQQEPSRTVLTVGDDGIGFDPALAAVQGGLGLHGMEERVAQLGGRLAVESTPGQGTVVRVEVGS